MEWNPIRIRLLREVGLCQSQDGFAKALGFAKRTLGNAERGTHPPSLALRRALDQALETASDPQRNRFLAAIATDNGAAPVVSVSGTPATFPALNLDEVRHLAAAMADARRYLDGDAVLYL